MVVPESFLASYRRVCVFTLASESRSRAKSTVGHIERHPMCEIVTGQSHTIAVNACVCTCGSSMTRIINVSYLKYNKGLNAKKHKRRYLNEETSIARFFKSSYGSTIKGVNAKNARDDILIIQYNLIVIKIRLP